MKIVYKEGRLIDELRKAVHVAKVQGREIRMFEFTRAEYEEIKRDLGIVLYHPSFAENGINSIMGIPFVVIG
jgi:hypothetical protein